VQKVTQIKKNFHIRELTRLQPMTDNQSNAMASWFSGNHIAMLGCAGTGKTFLALYLGLHHVLSGNASNVVIVRSAVPVRDVGFLPGEYDEKVSVFEDPYIPMCDQLFPYTKCYENLKRGGYVNFFTTSFVRGITFYNSIVIIDECQSLNAHELDSIITRLGDGCRLILCGDGIQSDLRNQNERKGFYQIVNILKKVPNFSIINFTANDIVRSGFVRDYIIARDASGFEC
jgi:phosphate starvation-inducible PhoH-like protein